MILTRGFVNKQKNWFCNWKSDFWNIKLINKCLFTICISSFWLILLNRCGQFSCHFFPAMPLRGIFKRKAAIAFQQGFFRALNRPDENVIWREKATGHFFGPFVCLHYVWENRAQRMPTRIRTQIFRSASEISRLIYIGQEECPIIHSVHFNLHKPMLNRPRVLRQMSLYRSILFLSLIYTNSLPHFFLITKFRTVSSTD